MVVLHLWDLERRRFSEDVEAGLRSANTELPKCAVQLNQFGSRRDSARVADVSAAGSDPEKCFHASLPPFLGHLVE